MANQTFTLQTLIERLWIAHENAPWTPKTTVLPLDELQEWMKSEDIEVLGFIDAMIHDGRFRIEPPFALSDYVVWLKQYYGRCLPENPEGQYSDSSYTAGWDLVRIFIKLWDDSTVPRETLLDLKGWFANLYKSGDERLRTCIVQATLEHLFERKPIKKYFADWKNDPTLKTAYEEACLWYGRTPLSR